MIVRRILRAWLFLRGRIDLQGDEYVEVPELAYRYAEGIAKATGLPVSEVLFSEPVRNYVKRLQRRVKVRVRKDGQKER